MTRVLRCKVYHESKTASDEGAVRGAGHQKSRCPGWARDQDLRQRLLNEAIADPDSGTDSAGHPLRLWNAVNDWYFVGVSTNEQIASYNCYPEIPATRVRAELVERARRTLDEVIGSNSI